MQAMPQRNSWLGGLIVAVAFVFLPVAPARSQATAPTPSGPAAGSDARTYVAFGIDNAHRGDFDAAIAAFNRALEIDPKYAPAYENRGFASFLQNKRDDAVADFTKAIQLDPTLKSAYIRRGAVYGEESNFAAATADFNAAIKLDPNDGEAHYDLGHVLYFDGKLDDAMVEISEAIRINPDNPYTYYIRGLINHAQDRRIEALSDFQKSLGLGYASAAYWIWIVDTENGEHGSARQDLSAALDKASVFQPDDWPTQIANFLLESITFDEMMAKSKAPDPSDSQRQQCEAWFYTGMFKHFDGDIKGAHNAFTKSVATGAKSSEEYVEAQRQLTAETMSP